MFLISIFTVEAVATVQNIVNIQASGMIFYPRFYVVGFENIEEFQYGPDAPIWDRPVGLGQSYSANLFEVENVKVHSGLQSAKLALLNPFNDDSRRIHVQIEINPYDKHHWLEGWYFIPEGFPVDHWTEIHRSLYDQIIPDNDWSFPQRQWLKIAILLNQGGKVADGEYYLWSHINLGQIDENGDGINDLPATECIDSIDTIRFGEWFKITTYLYRDKTHGIYTMWLNDKLQWNITDIRTIGVDPERFNEPNLHLYSGIQVGFGIYCGELDEGIRPKFMFFDDILISNEPK